MPANDASYTVLSLSAFASAQVAPDVGVPLDGSVPFSVDAWVRPHGLGASASILSKDGVFSLGTSGDRVMLQIAGYPAVLSNPARQPLREEQWHYVCVTYGGGQARIYIDGAFNTFQGISGTGSSSPATYRVGEDLQALVRTVRVYDTPLTAGAVMANMFGAPDAATIVADLDFSVDPPVDHGSAHLPITLQDGAEMLTNTPAMMLGGTAFAQPLWEWDVNPGGDQVDPYTVQAWIRVDRADAPTQAIFVNSDLESDTGMALLARSDPGGGLRVVSQRGSSASAQPLVSQGTLTRGEWHNVATTFDGTTLALYVDGAFDSSAAAGPIALTRNDSDLLIGAALSAGFPSGTTTLQGCISRMEVWSTALSAADVASYTTAAPPVDAAGLDAAWDFTTSPARSGVDGFPVALADGAMLHEHVGHDAGAVPTGAAVAPPHWAPLDDDALHGLRSSLDLTGFLAEHRPTLEAAMAADAAAFDDDGDRELVEAAWRDVLERMESDPPSLPFHVSSHVVGDERVLLCHARGETWVAYRGAITDLDDCTMWRITLIFTLVAGAIDALFAIRATLSPSAITYLERVVGRPAMRVQLSAGSAMSATGVFAFIASLISEGFFRELVRLIVDIGFWTFLRIVVRALATFAGIGAAAVIASLVATAATFIKVYLERPSSCDPLPKVELAGIKFNWDPTQAATDALSIRRNRTSDVPATEWTKTLSSAADSPALYAISAVTGKAITIQAKFLVSDPAATTAQVKADGSGILGAIGPFTVTFANGVSNPEWVTISLPDHQLATTGITRSDVTWSWSCRPAGGDWTSLATTSHRVYAVLAVPPMPWVQSADLGETQLPWTDVLDFACAWAQGLKAPQAAASAVTTRVNSAINLTYDTASGASAYTSHPANEFLCTQFVSLLKGGPGLGRIVNCTDCATIVTTFANVLGCNLFAAVMLPTTPGVRGFACNQIQAIGSSAWAYPFPSGGGGGFSYHEIPWTGTGTYPDAISDACLKVDSGPDPWSWGTGTAHAPLLPLGITFATRGDKPPLPIATPFNDTTYRERLATNTQAGIGACVPVGPRPYTQSGRRRVF